MSLYISGMQTIYVKQAHVLMYVQRLCVLCKHGIPKTSQLIITANVNGKSDINNRHYSQITDNHVRPPKKDKLDDFVYNLRSAKPYKKTNKWKPIAKETKHLKVNNYIKTGKVNSSDSNKRVANHQQAPYNDKEIEKQDAQNETSLDLAGIQSSVGDYNLKKKKSTEDQEQCPDSTTLVQEHKQPKQAPLELQNRLKEIYIQVPVPQKKPKSISKAEESFLLEMIYLKEMRKTLSVVEEYVR